MALMIKKITINRILKQLSIPSPLVFLMYFKEFKSHIHRAIQKNSINFQQTLIYE
jgi:hypothetical protein